MSDTDPKKMSRTRTAIYIRFTQEEYDQLSKDEQTTGESATTLLKKKYFKGQSPVVLLPPEERKAWFLELKRIGNNLNQLARKVNSGLMEGWYAEFTEVARGLAAIESKVTSLYGRRHL